MLFRSPQRCAADICGPGPDRRHLGRRALARAELLAHRTCQRWLDRARRVRQPPFHSPKAAFADRQDRSLRLWPQQYPTPSGWRSITTRLQEKGCKTDIRWRLTTTRGETRCGCFLPDLTGLARSPSTADLPRAPYHVPAPQCQWGVLGCRAAARVAGSGPCFRSPPADPMPIRAAR